LAEPKPSDEQMDIWLGNDIEKIVDEVSTMRLTERGNRSDDKRSESAMEDRKREGYF
jgi:3'-phosphoadenosine 5'-phosphosulfate sulfotransferase (PAPS reductase)/FAD synthetase